MTLILELERGIAMPKLTYKELLVNTFKKTALIYIIVLVTQLVASTSLSLVTYFKFYKNTTFSLLSTTPQLASNLGSIILWLFIYLLIRSNNENSEHFLHALFKIFLIATIYSFSKSIILNVLRGILLDTYQMMSLKVFLFDQFNNIIPNIIYIFFWIIVIKSRKMLFSSDKLVLFRNVAIGLIALRSVLYLYGIIDTFSSIRFADSLSTYLMYNNLVSNVFYFFTPNILLFLIILFVKNYDYYEVTSDIQINEEVSKYNVSLNNSLAKYDLIILLLVGTVLQFGLVTYGLFDIITETVNKHVIYEALTIPYLDFIIYELIIVISLTILVLKRKNAWLLTSFLGYGLYYLYFLIYVLFTLISALIIINTEANNSFMVSADLIVQVIIPLLMNLVYSLFISLIVYRYYKPFNYQMISVCGYVLITAIIGNILYNVVNSHNFQLISIVNITFSMQALVPIIVGSILTIVLLMFWIIFPLRLTNELSNQE